MNILDEVLWSRFAAAALTGMGTWIPEYSGDHGELRHQSRLASRADWASRQADAMLAEFRKRYPKPEGK